MRTRLAPVLATLALTSAIPHAPGAQQAPAVIVGPNVHVSTAHARYPMREVTLAADPRHPRRLLACGMIEATDVGRAWTVVYLSRDGGRTWLPALDTESRADITIDPSCTIGLTSVAHHTAIGYDRPRPPYMLAVWRSTDGGRAWTEQPSISMVGRSIDQQSIVVDTTAGRFHGRVYIAGATSVRTTGGDSFEAMGLWVSTDSGRTFAGPALRLMPRGHDALGITNAVVTSSGTVVTLYNEVNGETFGRSKPGSPNAVLLAIASTNGGESLTRTWKVTDTYLSWPPGLAGPTPRLAVDPGSADFKDRLYAVWSDTRSGRFEIYFSYSSDTGHTWSPAMVISDSRPFASGDGPDNTLPTVAVNREGVVGVTWYDRRDHPDNVGWHVRFRASSDGGETWQPSVRVSSASNDITARAPLPTQAYAMGGGSGGFMRTERPREGPLSVRISIEEFNFNPGDYAGLAADTDGVFHALWLDNRTGLPQVWTAPITVQGVAARREQAAVGRGVRTEVPERPEARPSARPDALTDVSSKVTLELTNSAFDRSSNTVAVTVRLKNTSRDTLGGPFQGRIMELSSALARRVELMEGALSAGPSGAVIDFTVARAVLLPGERSGTKRVVFRVSDLHPLRGPDEYRTDLVVMKVSVFARSRLAATADR